MTMRGLICPCVFSWGSGKKNVFDRPKFKSMPLPFTVCGLGQELIISKQCYLFCLKKKKNEVINGCPVSDLWILIMVFVFVCIWGSWGRNHIHNPTKSSVINTYVKYARTPYMSDGSGHLGLGGTTGGEWTLPPLIIQQWGVYSWPWWKLLGWLCEPARSCLLTSSLVTKVLSWCMFPSS